jgi:gamma-glutamyltranspeptidase/glutathione hydrolase
MVVSGSEEASRAGVSILEAGGNAVDAAVATALALGVAEPTSSGLGGETFILIYLRDGQTVAIDGSCYVPFLSRGDELQAEKARSRGRNLQGYKSVAVPGSLAAFARAVERFGTKGFAKVLAPAIDIADYGYRMSLSELGNVESYGVKLGQQKHVAELFLKDYSGPWAPDHLYCASDLGNTLRRIAKLGPEEFYRGRIADEIDADMERNGGYVRKSDLVVVRAVEKRPVRGSYRGFEVISFPYPGGGGMLLEMLDILETFPSKLLQDSSLDRLHLLIEAARIANTDSSTPSVPVVLLDQQLSNKSWAAARARLIRFDRALVPGEISRETADPFLAVGTTQVSVVDKWGNIVALTQTVGTSFGSGVATPGLGFMWNSILNAFDYTNPRNAHYLTPGRAAMTTMTPTVVLKDGTPLLVLGSAGSDRVVPAMVSVISGIADRGLGVCEAVAAPRAIWGSNYGPLRPWVELAGEITPEKAAALEKQGFEDMFQLKFPARWTDLMLFGATNVIFIDPGTGSFVGVGDPRRLGVAVGPRTSEAAVMK